MLKLIVIFGLLSVVFSDTINIYGTGLNDNHVAISTGSPDTHWTLLSSPYSSTPVSPIAGSQSYAYPNHANSQWIGGGSNLFGAWAFGNYRYQTSFDLTGLDPATASLSGTFGSDDSVVILINGVATSNGCTGNCWSGAHSFSITSGFVSGVNTLEFNVYNGGGPTGVQVAVSGTASPSIVSPEALCAAANFADWTPYGQGYYCWNENRGFLLCWGEAPNIQAAYLDCPLGTSCWCEQGAECSNHGTDSPCRNDESN